MFVEKLKRIIVPNYQWIVDSLILILNYSILFYHFPVEYFLLNSTMTGGDSGSHVKTFVYLKEYLMNNGKIIGWYPGNYGGYPFFLMYFPLLFVLGVLLSFFIPLNVSIKIMASIGVFLLPICAYLFVKIIGWKFPAPAIGATASMFFLYNFSNSMWGGNVYSNLAGEFTYAFSFALAFVFLALMFRLLVIESEKSFSERRKWFLWAIVIYCLMGYSHGFTMVISVLSVTFFLLFPKKIHVNSVLTFLVLAISGLIMAGWLFQLIVGKPYTTDWGHSWSFHNIDKELFDPFIIPGLIAFPLATFIYLILGYLKKLSISKNDILLIAFSWFIIFICVICFFFAEHLKLPDIRFLPFIQFICLVVGLSGIANLLNKLKTKWLVPFGVFFLFAWGLTQVQVDAGHWVKWNFQGFEAQSSYNVFDRFNQELRNDNSDRRVVYEHNSKSNSFGTVRAFENLYMFSGRSTNEGLYMQASLLSPSIFYFQSLYSPQISCPFRDLPCSSLNLVRAYDYFNLYAVDTIITVSDKLNIALQAFPGMYELMTDLGDDYQLWRVKNQTKYVEVLKRTPKFIEDDNWRNVFYLWVMNYDKTKSHLYTIPRKRSLFYEVPDDKIHDKDSDQNNCVISEKIENDTINFKTNCIGQPHLIKVSYHPGWRLKGGVGPYLASPGMLLVVPKESNVSLVFDNFLPRILGLIGTFIGIVIFALILFRKEQVLVKLIPQRIHFSNLERYKKYFFKAVCVAFVFVSFISFYKVVTPRFDTSFRNAELYYTKRDYKKAQEMFTDILNKWSDNINIHRVYYFLGLSYYLDQNHKQAIEVFSDLKKIENSEFLAEAYYHLGICFFQVGDYENSLSHFEYVINELKDPVWAKHSKMLIKNYQLRSKVKI